MRQLLGGGGAERSRLDAGSSHCVGEEWGRSLSDVAEAGDGPIRRRPTGLRGQRSS